MTVKKLTPERRKEIEARLEKATSGEWFAVCPFVQAKGYLDTVDGPVWGSILRTYSLGDTDGEGRRWETDGNEIANAVFVAHARQDIPDLLAALDAAEAENARLREALNPGPCARRLHEAYERLAPSFGYKPRDESAVPWDDVPLLKKELMIATVREVLLEALNPTTGASDD